MQMYTVCTLCDLNHLIMFIIHHYRSLEIYLEDFTRSLCKYVLYKIARMFDVRTGALTNMYFSVQCSVYDYYDVD